MKNRNRAKEHIEDAYQCLARILSDKCEGWDDYNQDYHKKLVKTWFQLFVMREQL